MRCHCKTIPHTGSTYWIKLVTDGFHLLSDPIWTSDFKATEITHEALFVLQQYRESVIKNTSYTEGWDAVYGNPTANANVFLKDAFCFHPTDDSLLRPMGNCSNCFEMCLGQTYFNFWTWQMDAPKVSIEGYDILFPTLQWKRGHTYTFMYTLYYEFGRTAAEVYLFTADFPSACGCPCGVNINSFYCASNCSTAARDNSISSCWLYNGKEAVPFSSDWRATEYEHWRSMFTYNHCARSKTPYLSNGATINVTCSIPLDEPLNKIYYAVPWVYSWVRFGQIDIVDPDSDTPTTTTTTPAPTTTAEPTTTTPAPTTTVLQTTTPAPVVGQWILAGLGESCATACEGISLQCDLRYQPITAETSAATIINYFSQAGHQCDNMDPSDQIYGEGGYSFAFERSYNLNDCWMPDPAAISGYQCHYTINDFSRVLCYCVDPPPMPATCVDDPTFDSYYWPGKTCADFASTEDGYLGIYCNQNNKGMYEGGTLKSPCYWCCAACTPHGVC